jgi:hypothetical protein
VRADRHGERDSSYGGRTVGVMGTHQPRSPFGGHAKQFRGAVMLLVVVALSMPPAEAHTRVRGRIRYAPGTDSVTLRGTVRKGHPDCWYRDFAAGEAFVAEVTRGSVYFGVRTKGALLMTGQELDESIRIDAETGFAAELDEKGRAYACVVTINSQSEKYSLSFGRQA